MPVIPQLLPTDVRLDPAQLLHTYRMVPTHRRTRSFLLFPYLSSSGTGTGRYHAAWTASQQRKYLIKFRGSLATCVAALRWRRQRRRVPLLRFDVLRPLRQHVLQSRYVAKSHFGDCIYVYVLCV